MNEPTRLRHEHASALEHALLNAGATTVASPETRAKTMAALGMAGSATLLAGMAGSSSLASAAKLGWMKLVVGVSLVGAAAAVPVGYYVQHRHEVADHVASLAAAPLPAPTRTVAPVAAAVTAPVAAAPVAPAAVPRAGRAPTRASLARELTALDAASTALAAGDARGALAMLDNYAHSYPHGRLQIEAEVIRIGALARSGRGEAARLRAEVFLRRHPQSVLATRVRAEAHLGE